MLNPGKNNSELVTISKKREKGQGASGGISRRRFLQVLGAGSAAGVVGCADKATQNIFPYVKGEKEQIPGVAVWYRSTCGECSAGCGIQVRTREGRAVKVEGNPDHPINKGGLCALGQASLQGHYDPDRVRQPLERVGEESGRPIFKPISWDAAYARVAQAIKANGKKKVLITGEQTGALLELTNAWTKATGCEHVAYDPLQPVALAKATEVLFGAYGIPKYSIEKAEVVLNFGADFLETWISPVEFARGWADGRRREKQQRVIHVEPRLSLTGANADLWLTAKPGTEINIALAVLKELLNSGRGGHLSGDVRAAIERIVKNVDPRKLADEAAVPYEKLVLAVQYLKDAESSLVLAGGAATATTEPVSLQVIALLLNAVLGNIGETVNVQALRKPLSSYRKIQALAKPMEEGKYSLACIVGTNPAFSTPTDLGFKYALKNVELVVSFSSHLDETAEVAHLILPSSSALESWGDSRPYVGVNSLIQPTMLPVFDTRSVGDILIGLASAAQRDIGGASNFETYLKGSWQQLHQRLGLGGDFASFWLACVERGGYFDSHALGAESPRLNVAEAAQKFAFKAREVVAKNGDLVVFPYASVRSFDGRAANRPWLQELPDPITKVVWDSWAEIHPATAKRLGLQKDDVATIRNNGGELNLTVYISKFVHPDIVAIPLGQGHSAFGRFARSVEGGNVFGLLQQGSSENSDSLVLLGAAATVTRGRGSAKTVVLQGNDFQAGRDLARSTFITAAGAASAAPAAGGGHHGAAPAGAHGGEHKLKQMYEQREHPVYNWGLAVDLNACTGCSACVVACYAENNIAVVGKEQCWKGREMSWIRLERYYEGGEEGHETTEIVNDLQVNFLPMMCQQCGNAPCEPVCPVYATYHNDEGLNAMIYNRCVGTRYCSNNCSYKVRRFNWFEYEWTSPLDWQLNPDVTKRTTGIMEKCTFCVQRITEAKDRAKDLGRLVADGDVQPACVQSCPTQALVFGNRNDPESRVSKLGKDHRAYKVLDHHLNTQPAISYLERVRYRT